MTKINGHFANELNIRLVAETIALIAGERFGYEVKVTSIRKRDEVCGTEQQGQSADGYGAPVKYESEG